MTPVHDTETKPSAAQSLPRGHAAPAGGRARGEDALQQRLRATAAYALLQHFEAWDVEAALASCAPDPEERARVRAGIEEHLARLRARAAGPRLETL